MSTKLGKINKKKIELIVILKLLKLFFIIFQLKNNTGKDKAYKKIKNSGNLYK
tara:strand:+ start:356 stop:514 length:159 start_codon:yes stop_codon:yes gene_type:complete